MTEIQKAIDWLSGLSEVKLNGLSAKAAAYLLSIVGKSIKVNGSLSAPGGSTVASVLSDETVKAMEVN